MYVRRTSEQGEAETRLSAEEETAQLLDLDAAPGNLGARDVLVARDTLDAWVVDKGVAPMGAAAVASLLWPTYIMAYDGDTPPPKPRHFTVALTLPADLSDGQFTKTHMYIMSESLTADGRCRCGCGKGCPCSGPGVGLTRIGCR